ncbi:hypothetical protein CB0940_05448 [Cercospora beticola]|uniref:Secreted protein n=1 Tax=Cercospora beticola TaxID=122368 RepID=A0A2G5I0F6_CERBT|nr:hypothetical protein CB0940_05448 [Cercospora beticola]PIA98279.1 hypothetical protein CB0940_05448 [Cercospora beticola]WPA97995.1 hypothetical protein RHO25_002606 [Cercospora beticola]CAK1359199.1 unnamed protein product [Cercospora beticola]
MKATTFATILAAIATGAAAFPAPIGSEGLIARDDQAQAAQQNTQSSDQAAAPQQVQSKQQQAQSAGTQEQQNAKAQQGQLSAQQQQDAQKLDATNAWCYDNYRGYSSCGPDSYYSQHVCQDTWTGQWYFCTYNDWIQQYFGYYYPQRQCYDDFGRQYPCNQPQPQYCRDFYNNIVPCNGRYQPDNRNVCRDLRGNITPCLLDSTESASVDTPFGKFSASRTTGGNQNNNPNGGVNCKVGEDGNLECAA